MATYETLSPGTSLTATAAQINAAVLRPVTNVPNIILDSDIGDDADDAATLSILHTLADRGECNILGTLGCCSSVPCAKALQAINTYYGRRELPVAILQDSTLALPADNYASLLAGTFPNVIAKTGIAANATTLYRLLLSNVPDHSVTILLIGYPRNLYHLYNSPADGISSLNGAQLIAAKVAKIVVMGGDYPTGSEHNFVGDTTGVAVFNSLKNDAVTVVFTGFTQGEGVSFDATSAPVSMPARQALFAANYAYWQTGAWDLLAVLYAVRGLAYGGSTYFALSAAGKNSVDAAGNNTFTVGAGNQYYLTSVMSNANLQAVLEGLLNGGPASSGAAHWSMSAGSICNIEGRVGIGTSAPDRPLEVNASDGYGIRVTYNDANGSAANYLDIFCGSSGTAYISGSGGKFATSNAINSSHAIDVTQAGQVAGTLYCNQIFQGTKYKKAVIYLAGCIGSYTWTFPTAFTHVPDKYGSLVDLITQLSATSITIDASEDGPQTGWVFVEGY